MIDGISDFTLFTVFAVFVIQFVLANISIIHLLKNKKPLMPQVVWHIIIIVFFIIGPIAYNIVERRKNNDNKENYSK